ncbi:hypothetical protein GH714_001938 [Hevea brasiliensis]|uniref:PHD-type domain-containing protein n=1 Tax=Hevea brasiliensis TaxID=3981 RepID=A0A6A6NB05_HEVBR|nr:hypothetical protein GH714_001938 [Hevea brasiliensis]
MANGTEAKDMLVAKVRPGLKREFEFAFRAHSEISGSLGRTRARRPEAGDSPVNGIAERSINKKRLKANGSKEAKKVEKGVSASFNGRGFKERAWEGDSEYNFGKNSDSEVKGDGNNVSEEGTSRAPVIPINKSSPILVNDSNSKPQEKPLRRFTRSLLKPKKETVKESTAKDGVGGNDAKAISSIDDAGSSSVANSHALLKTVKNDASKKFPSKLKDLLDSGILEGSKVKYMRGYKARAPGETGLRGVIKGSGILCFCSACGGNEVSCYTFFIELHAGSANKRPPEYIYLENGNTLRDVMNACKDASLETVDEAIRLSIGCSSLQKSAFCLNCRGSIAGVDAGKSMVLCSQCMGLRDSQASLSGTTDSDKGTPKPLPVPKSSDSVSKCTSSRSKSQGRLTTKDLRMHKLVFEEDVLPDGTEVAYYSRGQKLLVGYKKGFGIFCSCCNAEVSPSQFEAHAGWASRRKPGSPQCNGTLRPGIECLSLPAIPDGKWYCKFCLNTFQKEKFVERNANAIAAGRVAGIDPIEQITRRCIRIVKTLESEFGGCVLCRGHDFDKSFGPRTVLLCDQCEKEFHVGCLKDHNMEDLKELPKGNWFCCTDCNRIHSALEKLVVRGEEKLPDSCLNAIKKKHEENILETGDSIDVRWRLLNGKIDPSGDTEALLSEALSIFQEQFDPILVAGTSAKADCDLIPSMVFGDSVKGQELGGMYCAVLIVNQVVVSSAIIRFFGQELAELPLVATRSKVQGQGYFQALFTCIEKLLGFLNVKNLVLPAAEEAESIWTNKFGFSKLTQEEEELSNDGVSRDINAAEASPQVPDCWSIGRWLNDEGMSGMLFIQVGKANFGGVKFLLMYRDMFLQVSVQDIDGYS